MADPASHEPVGKVVAIQGQATVESAAGGRPLQLDSPVYAKDVIATGPGSTLEIRFVDDSVFSQGPSAKMTVDSYVFDPAAKAGANMLLNLAQGTFRTVTGEIAKSNPDGVKLQTPLATIGIRGTGVDFDIAPDGSEKYGIFQYDNLDLVISTPQ
ncbi:MAG: FecR domain-containing protein, partial [Thermodesulfobacteriota bacterium]